MKKALFPLFVFTAIIFTACSSGSQDSRINGTWKITSFVQGEKMEAPASTTYWIFDGTGRYSGFTTFEESTDTVHFENTAWRFGEGQQIEVQATPTRAFTADYKFEGEKLLLNVIDDPRDPIGLSYELEKVAD